MLIINTLKPFYIDKDSKIIRMGNFKNSAKEIECEDDTLILLFESIKEPISKEDLIDKLKKETKLSSNEIDDAIEYLKQENFIIDYDNYTNIISDELLNRQKLFFSMASDNLKDWDIKKQPNILVLGLGGVGSNSALVLSRAGFTNFTLVDFDKVEESNLIRQLTYDYNDVGKYKTTVIKNKINNDFNTIKTINKKIITSKDIELEIKKADFVICTLDKPVRIIRRIINDLCVKYNKPVIFSGFSEHVAMIGPFVIPGKTACLKCIDKEMNEEPMNNVLITPSYGPLCLMISSLITNEVINYFYKFNPNNLIGKTMMFNILTYELNIINWERNKSCEVCNNDSK